MPTPPASSSAVTTAAGTMGDHHLHELEAIRTKLLQLDKEAENRLALAEEYACHREATLKKYMTTSMATCVAWITSDTFYYLVATALHRSQDTMSKSEAFVTRTIYAVLAMILIPVVLWALRPQAGRTQGTTFLADCLKLVVSFVPMILNWAIMNVVVSLTDWVVEWWASLVVALGFMALLTAFELTPYYKNAKAAVEAGDADDTICTRLCMIPANCFLALGRAWNIFINHPITALQDQVAGKPHLVFFIQMVYYILANTAIILLTGWWSGRSVVLAKKAKEEEDHSLCMTVEHHEADIEMVSGDLFIGALSFVYAWALMYTLNDFFFMVICNCASASACSYQSNFAFAIILTIIFTRISTNLQYQDRKETFGKASQSLIIHAFSLCTGWAWIGYSMQAIKAVEVEVGGDAAVCHTILFLAANIFAGLSWHGFLAAKRRHRRQRHAEFNGTRAGWIPPRLWNSGELAGGADGLQALPGHLKA